MNLTFSFIPIIQYIATSKSILTSIVCFHHKYFILAILNARRQQTNIFDENRFDRIDENDENIMVKILHFPDYKTQYLPD